MEKVELLAPAGSMEAFDAALQNGADAIYCAGSDYGARAYAKNFTMEELAIAIKKAHVYGVKVYVTINTLIQDDELEDVIQYVDKLIQLHVDALIVADLGLLHTLRKIFPDLELHASTQMHIHNPLGIQYLKQLNVTRVVLPRETSIEDIKEYTKLGIEVEIFVHGAICVSYSGQCLLSSLGYGRSGNQGACAQPCRMRYTLLENNKALKLPQQYLLSPKDLNTLDKVDELIEAGVTSFKIEGRMKKSEYVALMTSYYRKAIDAYYNKQKFEVTNDMNKQMQMIYHRGFTHGLMFHQIGSKYHHGIRPNHIGIEIGTIKKVTKDKIFILLSDELCQHDGIRILSNKEDEGFRINRIYKDGLLVNKGNKGDIIAIDKSFYVEIGAKVLKTTSVSQIDALQKTFDKNYRKVHVNASFILEKDQLARLIVDDQVEVYSSSLCVNANSDMSNRYIEQLQKSKDTPFMMDVKVEMSEPLFLPIKEINQMRREALSQLEKIRANMHKEIKKEKMTYPPIKMEQTKEIIVIVNNEEQYFACKECGYENIYTSNQQLLKKYPELLRREYRVMKNDQKGILVQEWAHATKGSICEPYLNVYNANTAIFLAYKQVKTIGLSLELSFEEIKQLVINFKQKCGNDGNFAYFVYGREEVMISEYCVMQRYFNDHGKKHCGKCYMNQYALKDEKNRIYPMISDEHCRVHILNNTIRNDLNQIKEYKKIGVNNFFISFTIENKNEVKQVLKQVNYEFGR